MQKKNIFLSSPDPQSDVLADFRAALMKQGFKVFTNDGISPNSDLARSEIAIADCVVVGITETESQSDRFYKEISNALDEKKQLIVVQLEGDEIPQRLRDYAIIDLRNHFDAGLQLVTIAISGKSNLDTIPLSNTTPMASAPIASAKPFGANPPPKLFDAPIASSPSKPLTSQPPSSPISQEAANPATIIAAMFAIVVIGFVVLTNMPTGARSGGGAISSVSERAVSGTQVEFSTPNFSVTLPNTWEDNTAIANNSAELQQQLGISGLGRGVLQMGLSDRETSNAFLVMMLPTNNQAVTLRDLQADINSSPPQAGVSILESRLRSYGFGDALYVEVQMEETQSYNYLVLSIQNDYLYLIMLVSQAESSSQLDTMLRRFEIKSDASPVW
jgi:hypothetical protein